MPAGWEQWGIAGFLFFSLIAVATALVWISKNFLGELKCIRENTVARSLYEQEKNSCERCQERMEQLKESLDEIAATQSLIVQAQAANSRTLELIMFGRGGYHDEPN